jgi:hypothetical protein
MTYGSLANAGFPAALAQATSSTLVVRAVSRRDAIMSTLLECGVREADSSS